MARDQAANRALLELGWSVIMLWDFELRAELDRCVAQIESALVH